MALGSPSSSGSACGVTLHMSGPWARFVDAELRRQLMGRSSSCSARSCRSSTPRSSTSPSRPSDAPSTRRCRRSSGSDRLPAGPGHRHPAHWLVDREVRRQADVPDLADLFIGGSALCGLAWSAGSLIFFRALQGLGGGMILPIGQTILARAAGPQRMGRVMSIVGIPMLLGPVLGPVHRRPHHRQLRLALDLLRQHPDRAARPRAAARTLKSDATGTAGKLDISGFRCSPRPRR